MQIEHFLRMMTSMCATLAKKDLQAFRSRKKAAFFPRFFKTGIGQYGEGDRFIGVTVPDIRRVAKQYDDMSLKQLDILLQDSIHECRLLALIILVAQYKSADLKQRAKIVDFYLKNIDRINNWDLVDSSAPQILGRHCFDHDDATSLYAFSVSGDLWKQRIAMLSTLYFIKQERFDEALNIAEILVDHPHDLVQKAVGWMLREIGQRNRAKEERFLDRHYKTMPRTMLRYAIEKFEPEKRRYYMG